MFIDNYKRMRILYQYTSCIELNPVKGDLINEYNFVQALKKFADVHFARNNYDFDPKHYDIAFIRANKKMFHYCKGTKRIWMASPFDEQIYREADYVATFNNAWTKALTTGRIIPGVNPKGLKFNNVITINQTLSDLFLQSHRNNTAIRNYRKKFESNFVVGVFGRIAKSNYPHLLFESLSELVKIYPEIKVIIGYTQNRVSESGRFEPKVVKHLYRKNFQHENMPSVMAACDVIMINSTGEEWDICGSLKTIEAMSSGVPVILAESSARQENLPANYPYFLPMEVFELPITQRKVDILVKLFKRIVLARKEKERVHRQLIQKAEYYSLNNQSKRLETLFKSL